MELSQLEKDGIVILKLAGKLVGGPDASQVNDKLHSLLEEGKNKIVLDLSDVEWMNSSGLGILISALSNIRNAGGELRIAQVTDKLKNILTITKLINVLTPYDTIDQALESF